MLCCDIYLFRTNFWFPWWKKASKTELTQSRSQRRLGLICVNKKPQNCGSKQDCGFRSKQQSRPLLRIRNSNQWNIWKNAKLGWMYPEECVLRYVYHLLIPIYIWGQQKFLHNQYPLKLLCKCWQGKWYHYHIIALCGCDLTFS